MTDLETRLRETYVTVLDRIDPTDRFDELPEPAAPRLRRAPWWLRPSFAFSAAAVTTLAVIGVVALVGSEPPAPEPVAADSVVHVSEGTSLTEIRFPDASATAAGGVAGRPAVVAVKDSGRFVLRVLESTGMWAEYSDLPLDPADRIVGSGSDGETLAVVVNDHATDGWYTIHTTRNGSTWTAHPISMSRTDWGSPAAGRSTYVQDVAVDGDRVAVLVAEDPVVLPSIFRDALVASGDLDGPSDFSSVVSWGPEGIGVVLADGRTRLFSLAEVGIDPAWAFSDAEVWVTEPDGSTRGQPVGDAGLRTTASRWTPLSATVSGDSLYVGGFRTGREDNAVLAVTDLSSDVIEPLVELPLAAIPVDIAAGLQRVGAVRSTAGATVAAIDGQAGSVIVRVEGDDPTAWSVLGQFTGSIAEIALRGDGVVVVEYPGVVVHALDFDGDGLISRSLAEDWGVFARHPTGIARAGDGVVSLPQAGVDPSSFGGDGSAWIIEFDGPR